MRCDTERVFKALATVEIDLYGRSFRTTIQNPFKADENKLVLSEHCFGDKQLRTHLSGCVEVADIVF